MKNTLLLFLFALAGIQAGSQTQLMLFPPAAGGLVATDCWNAEISHSGENRRVYFVGVIQDASGQTVAEVRSLPLMLRNGSTRTDRETLPPARVRYLNKDVERSVLITGNFPEGHYTLCTRLIAQDRDEELASTCIAAEVKPLVAHEQDRSTDRALDFYGNVSFSAVRTSPEPVDRGLPTSFVRFQADPGISVYQVPVALQYRYTTETTEDHPDAGMFAIRFDRQRFEHNLQQLVLRKIAEKRLQQFEQNKERLAQMKERDNLAALLSDPSVLGIDKELENMQTEITRLAASSMPEDQAKAEELRAKYQSLLAKKNQIEKLKGRYEQLDALRRSLVESGEWENLYADQLTLPDLDDPLVLVQELKQVGAYTGTNKWLYNLKEFTVGTAFPSWSPLTLNGLRVDGFNALWNPGPLFVGVTTGRTRSGFLISGDEENGAFDQQVRGLRAGIGKLHSSYIAASYLDFRDEESSISVPTDAELFPERSRVGGLEFQLAPGKRRVFEWKGEVAALMRDHNTSQTLAPVGAETPEALSDLGLEPTFSSSYDFAYRTRATLWIFQGKTVLSGGSYITGPGFIHPGIYGLRNDVTGFDGRIEQQIAGNKLRGSVFMSSEKDNLSDGKGFTTTQNLAGVECSINFPSFPSVRLRFSRNSTSGQTYRYDANVLQGNISKGYRIAKAGNANSMLNVVYYQAGTDSSRLANQSVYLLAQQMLSLGKSWVLTLGVQHTTVRTNFYNTPSTGINLLASRVLFSSLRAGAGINLISSEGERRVTGSFDLNGTITRGLSVQLSYNNNRFSSYPGQTGNYVQDYFQLRMAYAWN